MVPLLVRTALAATAVPVWRSRTSGGSPAPLKLGADRRAWIEDDGGGRTAAACEFKEAAHEGGNDEADGLGPASRQKKHRPGGVVAHRRGVFRGHERVPDELHGKARVRIAPDLEGEDHCEGVQVAGHLEAAAGPRGPDLGADVIEGPHPASPLQAYAAQPERLRDAQVDPRVVDKADRGGAVAGDPADGLVDERPEEGEVPENLREADHRDGRSVVEKLGAGRGKARAPEGRDPQPGPHPEEPGDHAGRVLVARVLPGHDKQVGRAALRRGQQEGG